LNLRFRVSNALPYVVLALGVLFSVSPFVPILNDYHFVPILARVFPSYVAGGAFACLYTRGKVKEPPYVLAVPVVTFLLLAGMWLYFEFPGYYAMGVDAFAYGSVSFLYIIGHAAATRDWVYVGVSVLAYFVCVFVVVPPSSLGLNSWNLLQLVYIFVLTLGAGTPLALVAYVISSRNQSGS